MMGRRARGVRVFGPAYLDRVLRIDRSLVGLDGGPPLDRGVEGRWRPAEGLVLVDPDLKTLVIDLSDDWSGPTGEVLLADPLRAGVGRVRGVAWHDDLGGMGAGYASALGGELVCALGAEGDPISRSVVDLLERVGIACRPIRVDGQGADWTLLVTSGPFGDKLPIGFRGCHLALPSLGEAAGRECLLRVVAALPNRLAAEALRAPGASVRFFAPSLRNMVDRRPALAEFAGSIDILGGNRGEWETLEASEAEAIARAIPIVAITDGARGSLIRFRGLGDDAAEVQVEAFPRAHPPVDTNRAGEAFAATLLTTLLEAGWLPGPADESLIVRAARRASAAAALVLDRHAFGFASPSEIDGALRAGRVEPPDPPRHLPGD